MTPTLGTCYYPEHWPEDQWAEDAARMVECGLTWVRIGEFAWSRMEPAPGNLQLDWLDRAIDVLGSAGLKIILGTPTATPPRWMADKHPDMFARDAQGHLRGFGSRRHYCFSHAGYLDECRRITEVLAKRYGANPRIAAWQTDNEYGCHDTVLSYSDAATTGFRDWLAQRYQSVDALNRAWGNVFWSMEYDSFDQINLPNLTVTEPNPSHAMDFRRFSSDQVVAFNRAQVVILRQHSSAPILHNYMGRITEFDHFDVGSDLDIATWDSYPLGFLEDRLEENDAHKRAYAQQGDPDFQAFHHDLYRAVGCGRWWVMEQQPGPVNWAPVNPAPLPGMCRLWAWEAFAHGAETVCYFRWRQAPFAQEQMHAGMLRPDSTPAAAYDEARQVAQEIKELGEVTPAQAPVALVFDYASAWAWQVQPQGAGFDYFRLVFELYRAIRKLGVDVDIVSPEAEDLSGYRVVFAPGLFAQSDALAKTGTLTIHGPRSYSKTDNFTIPTPLPPNLSGLDATITHVESFRADMPRALKSGGAVIHWMEHLDTPLPAALETEDGHKILVGSGDTRYLAGWLDPVGWQGLLSTIFDERGIAWQVLPEGVRLRHTGSHRFAFNYANQPRDFEGTRLQPAGVQWRVREAKD